MQQRGELDDQPRPCDAGGGGGGGGGGLGWCGGDRKGPWLARMDSSSRLEGVDPGSASRQDGREARIRRLGGEDAERLAAAQPDPWASRWGADFARVKAACARASAQRVSEHTVVRIRVHVPTGVRKRTRSHARASAPRARFVDRKDCHEKSIENGRGLPGSSPSFSAITRARRRTRST